MRGAGPSRGVVWTVRDRLGWLGVSAVLSFVRPASGLGQGAEQLYRAGAFRAAADSFAARIAVRRDVPGHWFNLGGALYALGDDGGARAAWLVAARMAPRDAEVRQALRLVPPPDQSSAELTAVTPLTPGEAALLGLVLWIAAWVLVGARRPLKVVVPLLVAGLLVVEYGRRAEARYAEPLAIARRASTALRLAPYPSAGSRRVVGEGTVVRIQRSYGGWLLVQRGSERGWVQNSEVVPVTVSRAS